MGHARVRTQVNQETEVNSYPSCQSLRVGLRSYIIQDMIRSDVSEQVSSPLG